MCLWLYSVPAQAQVWQMLRVGAANPVPRPYHVTRRFCAAARGAHIHDTWLQHGIGWDGMQHRPRPTYGERSIVKIGVFCHVLTEEVQLGSSYRPGTSRGHSNCLKILMNIVIQITCYHTTSPRVHHEAPGWRFWAHWKVSDLQGSKRITFQPETGDTEQLTSKETRPGECCCCTSFTLPKETTWVMCVLSVGFIVWS